jgi:hypothetical protein
MISACYSNPNWDGKANADKRTEYLRDVNRHFNNAITEIYYPKGIEVEVDWSNPFFAAHKREIERTRQLFAEAQGKTMGELVDEEEKPPPAEDEGIDQSSNGSDNGRVREYDQDIPRNT